MVHEPEGQARRQVRNDLRFTKRARHTLVQVDLGRSAGPQNGERRKSDESVGQRLSGPSKEPESNIAAALHSRIHNDDLPYAVRML